MRILLITLLGLVLLAGCGGTTEDTASPATLAIYQVPNERGADLQQALQKVLTADSKHIAGSVSLLGNGQLVVLAPAPLHASLATTLEQLGGTSPASGTSGQPMRLQLWSVLAYPQEGTDDASLGAVAPVLAAVRESLGTPLLFKLNDSVTVTGMSDGPRVGLNTGKVDLSMSFISGNDKGSVTADLQIQTRVVHLLNGDPALPRETQQNLVTRMPLTFGETVVLAQFSNSGPGALASDAGRQLLLVRAEAGSR